MQFDFHISSDDDSVRIWGEFEAQAGAAKFDFKVPMDAEALGEVLGRLPEFMEAVKKKITEDKPGA
ncbi:MAG TPA: hypothetical protein VK797_23330 [Tepidisphaeraceae bacterium]|jgi:hypothetical protein|nr:hypothetical protein [Tepidisphaeraceae bacterium]